MFFDEMDSDVEHAVDDLARSVSSIVPGLFERTQSVYWNNRLTYGRKRKIDSKNIVQEYKVPNLRMLSYVPVRNMPGTEDYLSILVRNEDVSRSYTPRDIRLNLTSDYPANAILEICQKATSTMDYINGIYGYVHSESDNWKLMERIDLISNGPLTELLERPQGYTPPCEQEALFYQSQLSISVIEKYIFRTYWGNWVNAQQWLLIKPLLQQSNLKPYEVIETSRGNAFFCITSSPYDHDEIISAQMKYDKILDSVRVPGAPSPVYDAVNS
ncbi:MAG: hypothetical protein ABJA67_12365 [Chthonomonadales bacterium]